MDVPNMRFRRDFSEMPLAQRAILGVTLRDRFNEQPMVDGRNDGRKFPLEAWLVHKREGTTVVQ